LTSRMGSLHTVTQLRSSCIHWHSSALLQQAGIAAHGRPSCCSTTQQQSTQKQLLLRRDVHGPLSRPVRAVWESRGASSRRRIARRTSRAQTRCTGTQSRESPTSARSWQACRAGDCSTSRPRKTDTDHTRRACCRRAGSVCTWPLQGARREFDTPAKAVLPRPKRRTAHAPTREEPV
jgi:hypothetical protein